MSNTKSIQSDTELFAAALFQVRVSVWQITDDETEILEYGSNIEKFTPNAVKINGSYFLRSNCEFKAEV